MKTIGIIGSTGSIGKSTLKVLGKNKRKFKLLFLGTYKNYKSLIFQKKKYLPKDIFLIKKNKYKNHSIKTPLEVFKKYKNKKVDYIVSGISGYDAIEINLELLKITRNLLIANKETIICGGRYFLNKAKKNNCNIIPIDSEHYCLDTFLKNYKHKNSDIDKVYLIASGGPFLEKKIKYNEKIKNVLNHPTWKMGDKISIYSSNLSNKVLELFEAKILFNIHPKKLKILIEKKSFFHAIIKLFNNIYFPLFHKPDMKLTISNSLNLKNNIDLSIENKKINFLKPDKQKFPLIKVGYKILNNYSDAGMIIFTVLNERLSKKFLDGHIKYGDITTFLVKKFNNKNIDKIAKKNINSLGKIKQIIKYANEINI